MKAKPHELLTKYWKAKQARNKRLSLRYLAKKIGVSTPYLSKVFSGAKPIPLARVRALAKELELDTVAVRALERSLLRASSRDPDTQENLALDLSPLPELPSDSFENASSTTALEEWYYIPILDLVTCKGFAPSWIEERLGLRKEVAERAWARLRELGWVEEADGVWKKVTKRIRFSSQRMDSSIQRHHLSMLQKASEELKHRKQEEDFKRGLILGASVATNEESFRKAEKFLEESLFKAASMLATGPADRVYYLGMQLFPLTKR